MRELLFGPESTYLYHLHNTSWTLVSQQLNIYNPFASNICCNVIFSPESKRSNYKAWCYWRRWLSEILLAQGEQSTNGWGWPFQCSCSKKAQKKEKDKQVEVQGLLLWQFTWSGFWWVWAWSSSSPGRPWTSSTLSISLSTATRGPVFMWEFVIQIFVKVFYIREVVKLD